jgi:hypothetical protein
MMNERIKELMNQAAKQYYADTGEIKPNDMMYIFAELIVRECAEVVLDKNGPKWAGYVHQCREESADRIKEHFGVE